MPSLDELRTRVAGRNRRDAGRVRLRVLCGAHPLTDIGVFQAIAAPGTPFQVASQFNGLDAPGAQIVPVRDYPHDERGGRAPRSRPSRRRCCTTARRRTTTARGSSRPTGATWTSSRTQDAGRLEEFVRALTERFGRVRAGVHDDLEVAFGHHGGLGVSASTLPRARDAAVTLALAQWNADLPETLVPRLAIHHPHFGELLAAGRACASSHRGHARAVARFRAQVV